MNTKQILNENIKKFLKLRGETQKNLAEYLNVSKQAVCNWLTGDSSPDINSIAKICEFLEVSVNDLFGYYDEKYLNAKETMVVVNYRKSDLKQAVDKLLNIELS